MSYFNLVSFFWLLSAADYCGQPIQFIELIPMAKTAALPDAEFLCQLRSALEHFSDKTNITEDQVRRDVEGFYNDRACVICYNV